MRFIFFSLIFLIFTNCSFDQKSGIWNNENQVDKSEQSPYSEFKNISIIKKDSLEKNIDLKNDFKFSLSTPKNSSYWNQVYFSKTNNVENFKYEHLNSLVFKSKKISKYKTNPFILYDEGNLISSDSKGNIIVFSISKNKLITKFNFYKNRYKKIEKKLNLIIEKNIIYVSDNFGYLYAYDYLNNKIKWAKDYNVPFRSNLKIAKDIIFAANQNNNLFFFEKKSGEILKQIPTEETVVKNQFVNNLSIAANNIFFLNTYGSLYSVDINSKRVAWFLNLNQSLDLDTNNLFLSSQVLNFKNKVVVSSNHNLYVIDNRSGNIILKKDFSPIISPIIIDNFLFLITKKNYLISIDLNDGRTLYSYDLDKQIANFLKIKEKNAKFKSLMMANNKLLIFLNNSFILTLNVEGRIEKVEKLPSKIETFPIIIDKSILYLDKSNKLSVIN